MENFRRILDIDLPQGQSAFLWGIRKSGKSTYLKTKYPNSLYFDLLNTDLYFEWTKRPALLREQILQVKEEDLISPIIIDEIQKIPQLLDEVHWLIENTKAYFILCGSSARKLRRGAANLLGGRAWSFYLHPLSCQEIPNFDLLRALNSGLLASHYLSKNYKRSLRSYVKDYLKEEIQAESLVRNLPSFARFLDVFAFSNGELTNYSNIARDCGVDATTVKNYYQILIDTLMGYYVHPYVETESREIIRSVPKFYLADVGLATHLKNQSINILKGTEAGHALEHYILMELIAYRDLREQDYPVYFWRTKTDHEVDFVIPSMKLAIEVKISSSVGKEDLRSVFHFQKLYPEFKIIVVSQDSKARRIKTKDHELTILPWREFLDALWKDEFQIQS